MKNYLLALTVVTISSFSIEGALAGECLESRKEMLDSYIKETSLIINNPKFKFDFEEIEKCWYHWDPDYPNNELNDELGKAIKSLLNNEKISDEVKIINLNIAANAAPSNLFQEVIHLLETGYQKDLTFRVLLEIYANNAKKNDNISQFNYIKLFKKTLPEFFTPPIKNNKLCMYYVAMQKVYPYDYLKAKNILVKNNMFYPTECAIGAVFKDPRAFEDSNYRSHDRESLLFFALARHLELEFKIEWLKKIKKHQLRLLRNGIVATYGWKFEDKKLNQWFSSSLVRFCRNGKCGKTSDSFTDELITDIDKKNIEIIKKLEQL